MKYRRAQQTAWRTIGGETILLDLEGKWMYGLNPTGAYLWSALETPECLDRLWLAMTGGRESAPAKEDVESFLGELVALGLAAEARSQAPVAPDPRSPAVPELPAELEPPTILWREEVEQIAGTCAFFPSQNPLCDQVPFS